jgi:hypothetical protein
MPLEGNEHEDNASDAPQQIAANQGGESGSGLPPVVGPPDSPPSPPGQNHSAQRSNNWRANTKLGLEIFGVVLLTAYTVFSCLQWLQIRYTNTLTARALDGSATTLRETLGKMQLQVDATNNWAVAANAGLLTVNGIHVDANLKTLMIGALNIGHLPASGNLAVYELTVKRGKDTEYTVGFPIGDKLEGHWSEIPFTNVTYASPQLLNTRLPSINAPDYSAGQIGVVASGRISYNDGFPTTPRRTTDFCYISFFDLHTQQQSNAPCDASAMTERIKRVIRFPGNKVDTP